MMMMMMMIMMMMVVMMMVMMMMMMITTMMMMMVMMMTISHSLNESMNKYHEVTKVTSLVWFNINKQDSKKGFLFL